MSLVSARLLKPAAKRKDINPGHIVIAVIAINFTSVRGLTAVRLTSPRMSSGPKLH